MPNLRNRILSTAINLFQTRGINTTGVDMIVAEAGTTKMTLYKHFRNKENLILEVLNQTQSEFYAWIEQQLSRYSHQPDEKINYLFDCIEAWIKSPDFIGVSFLKASAEFPDERSAIHQRSLQQSEAFKQYIESLANQANIKDASALALQLSLLFEGAIQAEQMKRGCEAIKHAKEVAKILIDNAAKA